MSSHLSPYLHFSELLGVHPRAVQWTYADQAIILELAAALDSFGQHAKCVTLLDKKENSRRFGATQADPYNQATRPLGTGCLLNSGISNSRRTLQPPQSWYQQWFTTGSSWPPQAFLPLLLVRVRLSWPLTSVYSFMYRS